MLNRNGHCVSYTTTEKQLLKKQRKGRNNYPNVLIYDLAKMAMEMQIEEAATFVTLGLFYIKISFFIVIRKYISKTGRSDLLMESSILENGSLTDFLLDKSYKRSEIINQLLAL